MRERKKNWKPMVPSSHTSTFYSQLFVSERWYCVCHWEIVLWAQSFSHHENILVTCYYTAHLHSCVPMLIQSFDVGHLLAVHLCPCIFFFSYYTFTHLLYLSVGIQTCRGVPVEVRGWLREGSQSFPSTMWILGSVFKLKSKYLSLLSHLTSSTPVFKMYFL